MNWIMRLFGGSNRASTQATQTGSPGDGETKTTTLNLGEKVALRVVQIPPGLFLMGSPKTEKARSDGEIQHEVTISKPFYMGVTHVTVDQFAAFVKETGYKTDAEKAGFSYGVLIENGYFHVKEMRGLSWRSPSFDQAGDHPVVQVSWNDAQEFCTWLSKKTGKSVVLPSEAQWEYACRAGAKTAYPWGDNPNKGKGWANCADQSLKDELPNVPKDWPFFGWHDGFVFTSPGGSFKANAFGLYDMIGNAQQWCQDYGRPYGTESVKDPTGVEVGKYRVLRGGSWRDAPDDCRIALRGGSNPNSRDDRRGFRVAVLEDDESGKRDVYEAAKMESQEKVTSGEVRLVEKKTLPGKLVGQDTYEVYRAETAEAAKAFLNGRNVVEQQYYVIVETPEGIFGKDQMGLYTPSKNWRGDDWTKH